jgi:hypothetical protein
MPSLDLVDPGHHETHLEGQNLTSIVWGGIPTMVTQDFGVYNPATASMYDYAATVGWAAGTHVGLDVGVVDGTPIYAAEDGMVTESHDDGSIAPYFRPRPVHIASAAGYEDIYGHLGRDQVTAGQAVHRGQLLGWSFEQTIPDTMTPDGSGPHLHFERRDPAGDAVNPAPLLVGATTAGGGGDGGGYQYDFGGDLGSGIADGFGGVLGGVGAGVAAGATAAAKALPDKIAAAVYHAIVDPIVAFLPRAGVYVLGVFLLLAGIAFLFRRQVGQVAKVAAVV